MFHGMNASGCAMGWGWIIIPIFIIAAVFFVLQMGWMHNRFSGHSKRPLDILKERYAKGEIDKEEFDKRKKDL
ncbi:MAG: SHOCT domain-containing protein [Fibrobacterota bacterium]